MVSVARGATCAVSFVLSWKAVSSHPLSLHTYPPVFSLITQYNISLCARRTLLRIDLVQGSELFSGTLRFKSFVIWGAYKRNLEKGDVKKHNNIP